MSASRLSSVASLLGFLAATTPLAGCQGILGGKISDSNEIPAAGTADLPGVSTRYRRLTHLEWERTMTDLLGRAPRAALAASFRNDPRQGGFFFASNGNSLQVDQALWTSYQSAALELAGAVAADAAFLAKWAPSGGSDADRARGFVENFGERVHRRPLTAEQVSAYLALFETGKTSYDDATGFAAGIRLVLEAMFQSPFLLYRVEESTEAVDGTIPLDGYERAARLSYFLTGSMPDDALFAAAESGALDDAENVRAHALRLLEDPRAEAIVQEFFEGVLDVERYARIEPSAAFYPDAPADLDVLAREETRRFVGGVVFEEGGSFVDLLTSSATYVNPALAGIYGVAAPSGDLYQRVELDPAERRGVLTQVGFLAAHATSVDPDPIHRGVFVAKRLSCMDISAPPDAVPPLPDPEDLSNRELVERHTEDPSSSCKNCHSTVINPYGFPFENYDSIGAYRTTDRGHPVDASTSPLIDAENVDVRNALDLASRLAESTDVHECLVGHLVQFAFGRDRVPEDEYLEREFGARSVADDLSLRDLLVEIAVSRSFLERPLDRVN